MKVAIVLNTSWNIYNFRLGLLSALRKDMHQVVILAPPDQYSQRLVDLGYEFHPLGMDSRGVNPVRDFSLILELFRLYRQIAPDVILHYTVKPNIYGTLAAQAAGIPVINNVCGLGTVFLKKGWVSTVAKTLYRLAFRYPYKVFFQNDDDFQLFVREKLINPAVADIVPGSGIDLQKFRPLLKENTALPFTFLVISRLIYDKGILEYVEAVRQLRKQGTQACFQILGAKDPAHKRGIPLALIDSWIEEGLIDYLGTTDNVLAVVQQADCVVLPSYREGLPRTLLEAASMGKPIITTDTAGCRHVVDDGKNGFLCQVRSAEDLANKMLKMLQSSPEERRRMGERGRLKVAAQYDEQLVINKYQQTIRQMVADQGLPLITK